MLNSRKAEIVYAAYVTWATDEDQGQALPLGWGPFVGVGVLRTYRMYHVDADGRLRLGETFAAASDDEAVALARPRLRARHGAELWDGGRMAGRFSRDHHFLPGVG